MISNTTYVTPSIARLFANLTCNQCSCVALVSNSIAWNCMTINNTCQVFDNYSSNHGYLEPTNNGSFFFQLFPSHLLLAVSDTTLTTTTTTATISTTSTTSTSTTTTTVWDCIASLAGATLLLDLVNIGSQSYTIYSYTYTALTTSTRLTFSFRMDSNYWSLDTVSVKKSGTTTELLTNGDFRLGNGTAWLSCNPYLATSIGTVVRDSTRAQSGSFYWRDGSMGAATYLYNYFASEIGSNYGLSFYLKSDGGLPNSAQVYIGP